MRRCPRCTFPLHASRDQGVDVDHCRRCGGTFLDPGEAAASFGTLAEPSSWRSSRAAADLGESELPCPSGHGPMQAWRVAWEGRHVDVDTCGTCGGLWLDPREGRALQALLQAAGAAEARQRAAAESPGLGSYLFQLFTGFPIEVWNPVRTRPWAVPGLLGIVGAVFLIQILVPVPEGRGIVEAWALIPEQAVQGIRPWTLLTHAFLHVGWLHLLGNLYFLWVFGDNVEDTLGPGRLVLVYVLSALCGALVHIASDPLSPVPMMGASGAVSGLMGAYLVLFPRVKVWVVVLLLRFKLNVTWYLGIWVLLQAWHAAFGGEPVAWFAHLGGFGAGVLLALMLRDAIPERDRELLKGLREERSRRMVT